LVLACPARSDMTLSGTPPGQSQCDRRVAAVVESDGWYPGPLDGPLPGPGELLRRRRRAVRAGEDEVVVLAGRLGAQPLLDLAPAALAQRGQGAVVQAEAAPAAVGLGWMERRRGLPVAVVESRVDYAVPTTRGTA
jgi:hypothetical protein